MIRRGEIWWADFPDPRGSQPGYRRPVVVVQADEFNESGIRTVVVVILTSNTRLAGAPGNLLLSRSQSRLPRESVANVSQVFTIDRSFLDRKVSVLSPSAMSRIDDGLRQVLKL